MIYANHDDERAIRESNPMVFRVLEYSLIPLEIHGIKVWLHLDFLQVLTLG